MLTRNGWRVLRFTWAQVTRRPNEVVEAIAAVIAPIDPRGCVTRRTRRPARTRKNARHGT